MGSLKLLFIVVTVSTIICFCWGVGRNRRILGGLILWTIAVGTLAYRGFFENTDTVPPRILFLLLPLIALMAFLYRQINSENVNLLLLTGIHMVRIPVELVLYELYLRRQIPVIMTYAGWNFNIIVGLSAVPVVIYLLQRKLAFNVVLLRSWNYFGLTLLGIIVITAILSVPSPQQQLAFEQPNLAILSFPFTLLPGVVVPLVFLSHLLSLNVLKRSPQA